MNLTDGVSGMPDLILRSRGGETMSLSSQRGRVALVAFIGKSACHTGPCLEIADQLFLELGASHFTSFGCIVDLMPGEELREYLPFVIPVSWSPRRLVTDFLKLPVSGFTLPKFAVIDRQGDLRHLLEGPPGYDLWRMVTDFRQIIEPIIAEPSEGTKEIQV